MASRVLRGVMVGFAVISAASVQGWSADAPAADASPTLAWRLDSISSLQLGPNQPSGAWRRSAALLEAAGRLNPAEPRFPRLRALAMLHLEDTDGAIAAVREYRKLAPADRQAQSQLIDLYAGKMETVDAKLGYLRGLIEKEDLAPEVRSHIASECAALLLQKSKPEAVEMAARAVELYPLAEAARQYYELAGREQSVEKRVAALAKVLEASPTDVSYLNEMGTILASNGLAEQSIDWYGAALTVIIRSGPSRPEGFHNLLIDLASAQIIAGKTSEADNFLGQMLGELPLDPDAWFLKLTVMKTSAQATNGQILEMAKSALARRWNGVRDEILNGHAASQPAASPAAQAPGSVGASINPAASQPAATEPAKVEPLDAAPVIAKVKASDKAEGKDAAIGALSDLAWFELYYDNQPAAAKPWIDAMVALGADEALIGRFNGWMALQSGQVPQAREMLAKVAEKDALAALGLIRADEAEKKPVDPEVVRKLLADHQAGLLGAVLWDGLRSMKLMPATQPSATGIAAALAKFPRAWLNLSDPRSVRHVYEVQAEPVTTSVAIGDPLLFKVTVKNTSDHDITIGADSMLHSDLWLDAQILGMDRRQFRGVAFDRLGGELVLRPRSSTSQVVRLDVGELRTALATYLGLSTRVGGDVVTNPVVMAGGAAPGPGGAYAGFDRTGVQVGVQIGTPAGRKILDAELASASAVDRMHAVDLIAGCNRLALREAAAPELKKLAAELSTSLVKLRSDASPAVAAWAGFCLATTGPSAQGGGIAQEMSKSEDWNTRLLSLLVGSSNQKELATTLANDPDATVKSVAGATLEMLGAAASQPASQPVGQPGPGARASNRLLSVM